MSGLARSAFAAVLMALALAMAAWSGVLFSAGEPIPAILVMMVAVTAGGVALWNGAGDE